MPSALGYQNPSPLLQELLALGIMRVSTDGLALVSPDGSVFAARVATPVFDPVPGAYAAEQDIAITSDTAGATIYYTLDGSTPTRSSTLYISPIVVPLGPDVTIRAFAVLDGSLDSAVKGGTYTLTKAATPTFDPVAGSYVGAQDVTVACATPGVTLYYTDDGTPPTSASTLYTGPVAVAADTTLKAIAYKTGLTPSAVATADYVIT